MPRIFVPRYGSEGDELPSAGPPAFIQSAAFHGTGVFQSFTLTVTSGSLIVVSVACEDWRQSAPVVGDMAVTAGSATNLALDTTLQHTVNTFAAQPMIALYSCIATVTGTLTLTFTSALTRDLQGSMAEISGTWTASKLQAAMTPAKSVTDTTTPDGTITTGSSASAATDLFIGTIIYVADAATVVKDPAWTAEYGSDVTPRPTKSMYRIANATDAASWDVTGTINFYWWVILGAIYKQN